MGLDLDIISESWLRSCPSCDAGLSMSCVCPSGDPRNVISNLVDEVRSLRIELSELQKSARELTF